MPGRAIPILSLLLLSVLAGCGPADPPVPPPSATPTPSPTRSRPVDLDELLRQATDNTWHAPSKRLTGTITIAAAGQTKTLDYILVGTLAQGTQTDVAPQGSDVMNVIRIGDDVYIKAGEPYWQWYVSLQQRQFVVGKWVKARYDDYPSTVPIESNVPVPSTGVISAGTDTVGGTAVLVLADTKGNRYFVSEEGEPYLLRVEAQQETPVGLAVLEIEFSQLGEVRDVISAPSGEVVDLYHLPTEAVGHD